MDVKGAGTTEPRKGDHSNGLATLAEALREVIMGKIVAIVLDHAGGEIKTVGNYAVIDWRFDVINDNGTRERAGAVVRQGHRRPRLDGSWPFSTEMSFAT